MTDSSRQDQPGLSMGQPLTTESLFSPFSMTEWVCLVVAGMVLVLMRLHAFDLPLENDECNYAYIAQRLLLGDHLYVDVWDHQPPGIFMLCAGVIALFGDAPEVFRWLTIVFSLASMVLIYLILRCMGGFASAIMGVFIFALVSSDPGTAGEGCNREIFMNTFILLGWYFALRSSTHASTKNKCWLMLAGISLAVASVIKTIVAVHWLMLTIWVAVRAFNRDTSDNRVRSVVSSVAWISAGPIAIWSITFLYFTASGRFDLFFDATFIFNLGYSEGGQGLFPRFINFFAPQQHPFIFDSALPLWMVGGVSFVWLGIQSIRKRNESHLCVFLFMLGSYFAICLPGRSWPHYYYLMIPPLVIASSMFIHWIVSFSRKHAHASAGTPPTKRTIVSNRLVAWVVVISLLLPAAVFVTEYQNYLSQPLFGITVKRYNSRDFWGRGHGENIRRITDPEDSIFVFSNDASIYYYAQRRSASRYTMITGISDGMSGIEPRREILMQELSENKPRLIVVTFDHDPFPEWKSFLNEFYGEPIGWDFNDKTGEPIMMVLARKDQPVEPIDWDWDRRSVGGWPLGDNNR